jgi:fucose 4-O-acetylase-like acetyltransferase
LKTSLERTTTSEIVLPNPSPTRMLWVDYARGLAILLVVYRHTMVGLKRSGLSVPAVLYNIQEFLVNVRMPVFFVLSGIFLSRSLKRNPPGKLIEKKAKTLLYPYLLWTIILISLQILSSDYTNSKRTVSDYLYIITQPRELDHMWYLLALFNTSFLLILLTKLVVRYPILHISLAVIIHFLHYWVSEYSLVSDLFYYYIFLAAGVQASQFIMNLDKKGNSFLLKLGLIILPFFIAGQLFWLNNIDQYYSPFEAWYLVPFLLIIFIACVMFYCVCRLLYNGGIAKWLNIVGRSSLYIYILHILIISTTRILCVQILGITNVYMIIGISLLLGVTLPVLVYQLSLKWRPLRYLFTLERKAND